MGQDGFIKFITAKIAELKILAKLGLSFETAMTFMNLKGNRIAIDGFIWINANIAVHYRKAVEAMTNPVDDTVDRAFVVRQTIEAFIRFNMNFLQWDILPVWCWDGKTRPEKLKTLQSRKKNKDSADDKIESLMKELKEIPAILRQAEKVQELVNKLKYTARPTRDEIKIFQKILETMGIPSIVASYDGEALASSLTQEGLVAGVWSTDSDNYPLGTSYLFDGFMTKTEQGIPQMRTLICPYVAYGIGFTQDQFRDWYILCGTDFNLNMVGIGAARAYDAIKKYGTIEAYLAASGKSTEENLERLNYVKCREILKPFTTGYNNSSSEINFNHINFAKSRDYFSSLGLSKEYETISIYSRTLSQPKLITLSQSQKSEPEESKMCTSMTSFVIVSSSKKSETISNTKTETSIESLTFSIKNIKITNL